MQIGTFKAKATIVRELRAASATRGPVVFEVEVPAQTATNRDGSSCELSARTIQATCIKRMRDEGIVLAEGDEVAVLIEPVAQGREGRIIHKRKTTWGRR